MTDNGDSTLSLSNDDIARIIDWFVLAHREVHGSCGPEANDLVRRLIDHARFQAAVSNRNALGGLGHFGTIPVIPDEESNGSCATGGSE